MSKLLIGIIIIALTIFSFGYFNSQRLPEITEVETDTEIENTEPTEGAQEISFQISGNLEDVTGEEIIRSIKTLANTSGFVKAGMGGTTFVLNGEFQGLPDPKGSDFYEGWVVRRGEEMSVISTGRLEKEDGFNYSNIFTTSTNLLDHNFYVLTLEPDDDDPAPADHILEGVLR